MALPAELDLNGAIYSHASCDVKLNGLRMKGAKEFNWKCTVESGEGRGTAREVLGYTIGDVKYESGVTLLRGWWEAYKAECRANGRAPMDRPGSFSIVAVEAGKPTVNIQILFAGLSEADNSSSAGPDPHEVKCTFKTLVILENGKPLVERSLYTKGAI